MTVKHSPGPWSNPWEGPEEDSDVFYDAHRNPVVWVDWYDGPCLGVRQEDAALIAAAPDMLEALENLENDSGQIPPTAWDLVCNAVAKAGGRAKDRAPVGSGWTDVTDEDGLLASARALVENYDAWVRAQPIQPVDEDGEFTALIDRLRDAVANARGVA